MTDRDVVERFRDIVGAGSLYSSAPDGVKRKKRLWRLHITEVAEIVRVTQLLYPWLGERRRARADEVIAAIERRIAETTYARVCPTCQASFRPQFTPNAKTTIYCSRKCERRHNDRRWGTSRVAGQIGLEL